MCVHCTCTCTGVLFAVGSLNVFSNSLSSNCRTAQSIHYSLPGGGRSCDGEPDRQHLQQTVIWIITILSLDSFQPSNWHSQLHSKSVPDVYDIMEGIYEGPKVIRSQSICIIHVYIYMHALISLLGLVLFPAY